MDSHRIVSLAGSLKGSLQDLIACQQMREEVEWAQHQLAGFNIWAEALGVFAEASLSITYRLRENGTVRNLLLQLLNLMQNDVRMLISLTTGQPIDTQATAGSSDDSDSSSASSLDTEPDDFNELKLRIEHTLKQLGRFALRLRVEGAQKAVIAAESFEPLDETGAPLAASFLDYINTLLAREFDTSKRRHQDLTYDPDTGTHYEIPPYLRTRIQQTMLARWRRISYRRHHGQKLGKLSLERATGPKSAAARNESSLSPVAQKLHAPTTSIKDHHIHNQPKTVVSAATTLPAAVNIDVSDLRTRRALSISTKVRPAYLSFPAPPRLASGQALFICPYCALPQPVEILYRKNWQKHLMKDLAPYFCIQQDCTAHMETRTSSGDWESHLLTSHAQRSWTCSKCALAENTISNFDTREEFVIHCSQLHLSLGSSEINLLAEVSREVSTPKIQHCLFCGFIGHEGSLDDQKTLIEHMLQIHMQAYALSSIPWDIQFDETEKSLSNEIGDSSDDYRDELFYDDRPFYDEVSYSSDHSTHTTSLHTTSFSELRNVFPTTAVALYDVVSVWLEALPENIAGEDTTTGLYESQLLQLASAGDVDGMKTLLAEADGLNMASIDEDGRTILHLAVISNVDSAVEFVLSLSPYNSQICGAELELDRIDNKGSTALMYAASGEYLAAVELLLSAGASTTTINPVTGMDLLGMVLVDHEKISMTTRLFALGLNHATILHATDLRDAESTLEMYLRPDKPHFLEAAFELNAIKVRLDELRLAGEPAAMLKPWQIKVLRGCAIRARTKRDT